jgi:lysophospholipase L1-like esterase
MRRLFATTVVVVFFTLRLCGEMPLLAHQRVLVLGDSITQDGRYVSFLEYYLQRLTPGAKCDLISIGLSSETVSGLTEPDAKFPRPWALERLDRALAAVKPKVVLACYGMNDGIYAPASPERLAAFEKNLRQFTAKVRAAGAQLVLIAPPIFDPVPLAGRTVPATAPKFGYGNIFYERYDDVLAEFARIEATLKEPGVTALDLHTPMAAALAERRTASEANFTFSKDGVHPGDLGHLLMARIIGRGLGLPIPDTSLDAELTRIRADPIWKLVVDRRELRSEAWLPYVGYTPRDTSFKSGSVKAAERVAASLQELITTLAAAPALERFE